MPRSIMRASHPPSTNVKERNIDDEFFGYHREPRFQHVGARITLEIRVSHGSVAARHGYGRGRWHRRGNQPAASGSFAKNPATTAGAVVPTDIVGILGECGDRNGSADGERDQKDSRSRVLHQNGFYLRGYSCAPA